MSADDLFLLAFLVALGLAVFLLEWGLVRSFFGVEERRERALKRRLEQVGQAQSVIEAGAPVRQHAGGQDSRLNRALASSSLTRGLPLLAEQAGMRRPLSALVFASVALGVTAVIVVWLLLRSPLPSLLAGIGAATIPWIRLVAKRAQRLRAFDEQLPDALDIIVRALKAGYPFDAALQVVAEELPDPVAEEFAITSADLNYGVTLKQALEGLLQRVPSLPLRAFVTAVVIQRETGGNLAEILSKISSVIRGVFRFQRRVRTLSAEGRLSIGILAAVPLVLGIAMIVMFPDLISELFTNPVGRQLMVICTAMFIVGYIWARRIVRIDV